MDAVTKCGIQPADGQNHQLSTLLWFVPSSRPCPLLVLNKRCLKSFSFGFVVAWFQSSGLRTTTLLVSYCYLSPSSRIRPSDLFLFLSHLSHLHLIIRAAPYTNTLFLCIHPFRFLDSVGFGRISQPSPVFVSCHLFPLNISSLNKERVPCAFDCTAHTSCSIGSFPLSCFHCH